MSKHNHPHGVVGKPNPERVWICEDCSRVWADDEIRRHVIATGSSVHVMRGKRRMLCEGHLDPYTIDTEAFRD